MLLGMYNNMLVFSLFCSITSLFCSRFCMMPRKNMFYGAWFFSAVRRPQFNILQFHRGLHVFCLCWSLTSYLQIWYLYFQVVLLLSCANVNPSYPTGTMWRCWVREKIDEKIDLFIGWVEKHPNKKSQVCSFFSLV